MLSAHHIGKLYRGRRVVDDVSLFIRRGEAVGLLGPNGAGKTTVFSILTGITAPDQGAIWLDQIEVTKAPMFERARRGVSYLPQEPSAFRGLTVEQNILLVLECFEPKTQRRQSLLDALLTEFGLDKLRRTRTGRLSGGERRRCEIARALASGPSFVLLDEPFAGIDPIALNDIRALVRSLTRHGIGVLISDHNVRETLSLVDRAYIIDSGQILMHGTPADIVANADVRRLYLGAGFRL